MAPAVVRVCRYLRVSKLDQNPRLQDDETKEFIARRGWELGATYIDHGVSGSKERRPELDKMLAEVRRKKLSIVVWRADRMFRSLKHMVNTLDELNALGVNFVSVTEPFDTTTPSGRLLLHLVSAMAEFERSILIERTRAGVAAARRRGARLGRPRARLDEDRLRELRQKGWPVKKLADEMGVGTSTIQRHLVSGTKS
ncbi:MAG: recombinase family protein [Polyangiaceae bacterium]|jgi:DNA invertase Pin-like site-specific DNA recombinase